MKGSCDLNVIESSSYPENLANISQLIALGYNIVAINHVLSSETLVTQKSKKKNRKEKQSVDQPVRNQHKKVVESMKNLISRLTEDIQKLKNVPADFKLLTRVTFCIDTQQQLDMLHGDFLKEYFDYFDLVAIATSSMPFIKVLAEGKIQADIITLPLENKLQFKLNHKEAVHVREAVERQRIMVEISYTSVIKSPSLRKYIFSNGKSLVSMLRGGRGVIMSSGGESRLDFRAPHDVVNLSNLFEFKGALQQDCVCKNGQRAIAHAAGRKQTFKGVLTIKENTNKVPQKRKNDDEEFIALKKTKI